MGEVISVNINGKRVSVPPGRFVLEAVNAAGVHVPVLCHDPRLTPQGSCGICVVEVEGPGAWSVVPACATPVRPDMEIRTESESLRRSRRWTVELLFARHASAAKYYPERVEQQRLPLVCACRGHRSCALRGVCLEVEAVPGQLETAPPSYPPELLRAGIELEMDKCIRCERCVRICREVAQVEALSFLRRGSATTLAYALPSDGATRRACDACEADGALCIDTCPTDALHRPRPKLPIMPAATPSPSE